MHSIPSHGDRVSKHSIAAIALSLAFLGLYVITSSHTVILHHDDAAEFQTIGVLGGVPHQPYPLWCVIARNFALLPVAEPAFRITLLSAVFASLTVGALFLFVLRVTGIAAAAAGAAIALGLSMTFWRNAVVAEVYTLNAFIFVSLLVAGTRWLASRRRRDWLLFTFVLGLLLSHHQMNVALLPAIVLAVAWQRKHLRRHVTVGQLAAGAALLLLPFSLYLYTYMIGRVPSPMNWYDNYGQYLYAAKGHDSGTFEHFAERLRFQMFVGRLGPLLPSAGTFVSRLVAWLRGVLAFELPVVASLLAAVGFWVTCRRRWILALLIVTASACVVFFALVVGGGVTREVYSLPVLILLAVLAGVGMARVVSYAASWRHGRRLAPVVLLALLVAIPYVQLSFSPATLSWLAGGTASAHFRHLQASNGDGRMLADRVAAVVPAGSIVFAKWSASNVLRYAKFVDGDLAGVDVSYILPEEKYMESVIADRVPQEVYFLSASEPHGFETLQVIPVMDGFLLYRVAITPATGR